MMIAVDVPTGIVVVATEEVATEEVATGGGIEINTGVVVETRIGSRSGEVDVELRIIIGTAIVGVEVASGVVVAIVIGNKTGGVVVARTVVEAIGSSIGVVVPGETIITGGNGIAGIIMGVTTGTMTLRAMVNVAVLSLQI